MMDANKKIKKNWVQRQLDNSQRIVDAWSDAKKIASGVAHLSSPKEEALEDRK